MNPGGVQLALQANRQVESNMIVKYILYTGTRWFRYRYFYVRDAKKDSKAYMISFVYVRMCGGQHEKKENRR